MINPKATFKKILKDWGHDILYQRRLSDDFVYCDTLERITTRNQLPRSSSLMVSLQEQKEGNLTNHDLIYFFESNVNPKSGDRIYEESYDSLEDAIIYLIDLAHPVRGRRGEINFWMVGVTKERPSS
jgi:hypothetical protein